MGEFVSPCHPQALRFTETSVHCENMMNTSTSTATTKAKLSEVFNSTAPPFKVGGSATATRILDSHNVLGECILYDDENNKILWTDINGRELHRLGVEDGNHEVMLLPKMLGAFALRPKGSPGYLCAWEDGFQLYDVEKGENLSDMSVGEDVNPKKLPTRLNDGRVDPTGKHFVCGGFYGDIDDNYMKVYKCKFSNGGKDNFNLIHEAIVEKIQVTNSICWSTDGKTMYLADSPTKTIFKHDYDQENGTVSNKRILHEFKMGVPDGSCVDSNGNIWNAMWRNGVGPSRVQCIDASTGDVIYTINVPDSTSQLTCCCFGGPNLDVLFVSSAHINRDRKKEEYGGCVYAVKIGAGVKGCLEKRFCGK